MSGDSLAAYGQEINSGIYVGCQGWRYTDWRVSYNPKDKLCAPFYTRQISLKEELHWYSKSFAAVEVDSTFYAVPNASSVETWRDAVPHDFLFTMKMPRALTHEARLRRGGRTLKEFCSRAALLGDKLAALLIQLPPSFSPAERPALERFLPYLPRELPFAVEFRDPAWLSVETMELLDKTNVALCLGGTPWMPTAAVLPWTEALPGDFVYLRLMGIREGAKGGVEVFTHRQTDQNADMDLWAPVLLRLAETKSRVIALVDNHYEGYSPGSAALLQRKIGHVDRPFPAELAENQLDLF